jgi:hypothetical protein
MPDSDTLIGVRPRIGRSESIFPSDLANRTANRRGRNRNFAGRMTEQELRTQLARATTIFKFAKEFNQRPVGKVIG